MFFLFFLASGFCGLLYEVIWTRLAMATFGATTTVVSIVLSVFMAGLALGSWLAGRTSFLTRVRTGRGFLRMYALVELGIGTGAWAVPFLFERSRSIMLGFGASNSSKYHVMSAVLLTASMLPWATLMGATYALAMSALRAVSSDERRAFSYLYLANVLGAAIGALTSAVVLVELLGFKRTLLVAAALNTIVSAAAWMLSARSAFQNAAPPAAPAPQSRGGTAFLAILFATGFVSMALELIWTRLFSLYLGTFVYSFAAILTVYLLATYLGSAAYRRLSASGRALRAETWWVLLPLFAILPLAAADPRVWAGRDSWAGPGVLLGIVPFCAALGFLTPLIVDRYGAGDPGRASRAYAVNVIGCIFGPLIAGYLLLPLAGERWAIVATAAIPAAMALWATAQDRRVAKLCAGALALTVAIAIGFRSYAENIPGAIVKHDHVATVVAYSEPSGRRMLLVNGVGITIQTTITKLMAHFPLAHLHAPPESAIVICFGMGTTFRSLLSWNIATTAVDLVPSVPTFFKYYNPSAPEPIKPGVAIVIDDGRRYLQRTRGLVDLVTIDPPPPVEAAGSSLLYSREFYRVVKTRLKPDGILQQWLPTTDPPVTASVVRALTDEFKYVRIFGSFEGWGLHFMASNSPTPSLSASELVRKIPPKAIADLSEWLSEEESAEIVLGKTLDHEVAPNDLIAKSADIPGLSDDRPTNEYFFLRDRGLTP